MYYVTKEFYRDKLSMHNWYEASRILRANEDGVAIIAIPKNPYHASVVSSEYFYREDYIRVNAELFKEVEVDESSLTKIDQLLNDARSHLERVTAMESSVDIAFAQKQVDYLVEIKEKERVKHGDSTGQE